jgi:hypothetical protein
MCGTSITNITQAEAEGLSWELTRDPFNPDPTADYSSSSRVADRLAVTGPSGLTVDDINSVLLEQEHNRAGVVASEQNVDYVDDEYDADYEEVLESWDVFVSPDDEPEGRTVVYISMQLENSVDSELRSSRLMEAAVKLTGASTGNVLVLDDPANTALDSPYTGVVIVVATSDTEAMLTHLESLSEDDVTRAINTAGVSYLPWSIAVSTHSAPFELVAGLDHFQPRDGLSSTHIALIASAAALLAAAAFITVVWVSAHRLCLPATAADGPDQLKEPKKDANLSSGSSVDDVSLSVPAVPQA